MSRKKAMLLMAALAVLIVGCTTASHMKALHTPPVKPPVRHTGMLRGIAMDWYASPGQHTAQIADIDVRYVLRLHADAISISFPFFTTSAASSFVYASPQTPNTRSLAILISKAERAGLYVMLRPLMDEKALGKCRCEWIPPVTATWFASYRRFLEPYVSMAARLHVPQFVLGTEFTRFQHDHQWKLLRTWLAKRYQGKIAYADNGLYGLSHGAAIPRQTIDAYPSHLTRSGSGLRQGWLGYARALPHKAVLSEVGIGAIKGAWRQPWVHHWPASHLDLKVQARWFAAACHAAAAAHLGGIYFWPLNFGQSFTGPTLDNQGNWAGSPAARAISSCYLRSAVIPQS